MQIIYNNIDITNEVDADICVHDTYARAKADTLMIRFKDKDSIWDTWKPNVKDKIEIRNNGNTTGRMNVEEVNILSGRCLLRASAMPHDWKEKHSGAWEGITFKKLASDRAKRHGLDYKEYEVNDRKYRYIQQDNENDFEFLERVAKLEGNEVVVFDNTLIVYGIKALETSEINSVIEIDSSNNVNFERQQKFGSCVVNNGTIEECYTKGEGPEKRIEVECDIDSIATGQVYAENMYRYINRHSEFGTFYTNPVADSISAATVTVLYSDKKSYNGRIFIEHVRNDFGKNISKVFFRKVDENV